MLSNIIWLILEQSETKTFLSLLGAGEPAFTQAGVHCSKTAPVPAQGWRRGKRKTPAEDLQ